MPSQKLDETSPSEPLNNDSIVDDVALDRNLALDVARVTEAAALAAARHMGRGDERAADLAASRAMRQALSTVPMVGKVTLGGEAVPTEGLFHIGETVGTGTGRKVDIGLIALEGATICAMGAPNAAACMALAREGGLLAVPTIYMEKIAVGPGVPEEAVSLDASPAENVRAVAEAKGVPVEALLICVLDRPRNEDLIAAVREVGARISLISDGDVSGAVSVGLQDTGVDMYMGSGGATEGVLAAAGLRCLGGSLQGRLMRRNDDDRAAIAAMGIKDPDRILTMADMVPGEVLFSASGVTDGALLRGVRLQATSARTSTIVMRSRSGTLRMIDTRHDFTRGEAEE